MSAHTPGPWVTVEVGEFASALAVSDQNGVSLLTVVDEEGVKFGAVYNEADADLIAAAPDLLEALKDMLEVHGVRWEHVRGNSRIPQSWAELSDKARAAITKATGGAA